MTWSIATAARSYSGLDVHEPTFARLAQHFFTTFPQIAVAALHPPLGRGRSTPAAASRSFSAPPTAHRDPPMRSVTPAWAWPPRGSGPRWALDLVDGRRHRRHSSCSSSAGGRCPSRRSRCGQRVIQLTRNRLAAAHRRQGRRGLWLGAVGPPGARVRQLTSGAGTSPAPPAGLARRALQNVENRRLAS